MVRIDPEIRGSTRIIVNDSLIKRFNSKFVRGEPDECWLFTGSCSPSGHGQIGVRKESNGKHTMGAAHRVALILNGIDVYKVGGEVCHTCKNPPCVNPAHLY